MVGPLGRRTTWSGGPFPARWAGLGECGAFGPGTGLRCGANRANHEPFTPNKTSTAGARTSVSAPLDLRPQTIVPMGGRRTWIGQESLR